MRIYFCYCEADFMNKTRWLFLLLSFTLLLCGIPEKSFPAEKLKTGKTTTAATAAEARKQIFLIEIDAPITPVVAEYIVKSIDRAQADRAEAIIIQLNTPGGLVDSMQQIVMKMMAADVPTVVYVAPSGARAASAGVFITMAAHIAAMAPTTHMGAAHPVTMQGKMDKTMKTKVVKDPAGMARGCAETCCKHTKVAEQAVRKSASFAETEAHREQ